MPPRALPTTLSDILSSTTDNRVLEARQLADKAARAFTFTYSRSNDAQSSNSLHARQNNNGGNIVAIPTVYAGLNSGPAPGVVVGIVLGSVLGFLFLLWLFMVLSKGAGGFVTANQDEEESVVITRERRRDRSHRSSRSQRGPEMSRSSPRRDRVYRQERIIRDFPPAARSPSRSRVRETVIVDDLPPRERRVDGDDIVEVIEEHSDINPPRRKSRRGSGYRSVEQHPPDIAGGFRPVDPSQFAGGNYRQQRVR